MSIFHKLDISKTLKEQGRKKFVETLAKEGHLHEDGFFHAYWTTGGVVIEADPSLIHDILEERKKHGYTRVAARPIAEADSRIV